MSSSSQKNKSSTNSKFCTPRMTSSSSFSSPSRPTSPNRITLHNHNLNNNNRHATSSSSSSSIRFMTSPSKPSWSHGSKKTCLCSPTTHPGSFRCSLHKNINNTSLSSSNNGGVYHSNRLHARRSAMTNSLVRIGTVEGDLVKRALAALIRPSSHQQRRRSDFRPTPTRLSKMSKAGD
nr:protein O-mannosyltransferase [Tanacetum cinerariifolium]